MKHSRGRIKELLAVSFNGDPEYLLFFRQCLEDEVYAKHFCRACHQDLPAEDSIEGQCMGCDGSDFRRRCIQFYDPASLRHDEEPPQRLSHLPFLESRTDQCSLETGYAYFADCILSTPFWPRSTSS